jgi:hypothetical protein
MADQEHVAGRGDDSRLPVPAGERRPEVHRTGIAPVDSAHALMQAAGAPLLAPLAAAAVVGATAAAVTEVVTRMMRPWLAGGHPPTTWSGPGVHISYTHLEVHWPQDR